LEGVGWLTSRWEDVDPRVEGRPARRYYQLTSDGLEPARAALSRAYSATARPPRRRPPGEVVLCPGARGARARRAGRRPVGEESCPPWGVPGAPARRASPPGGRAWPS